MFSTIISALFPVFGLILLGWSFGRINFLGKSAFEVLNRLVISVTLPVLTFRTLAHIQLTDTQVPVMALVVLGGAFAIYAVGFAVERLLGRNGVEANIAGLTSCFSNYGFVGLPVALIALGPESLAPVAVATALYSSAVFGLAVLLSELNKPGGEVVVALKRAAYALSRSPLIVLAGAGIAWSAFNLPLTGPIDVLLETLARATAPCALIAIGLFIALPRNAVAPLPIGRVIFLKLIGHPAATAGVILLLPPLPPLWSATAILMAAMPCGASSFVLAGGSGRWAMELSAWSIALSTILAAVTLVPILLLLAR